VLSTHAPHVLLLQAWPLQSQEVEQAAGAAHAGVDDGVRMAWS